jgi:hypothetical protein
MKYRTESATKWLETLLHVDKISEARETFLQSLISALGPKVRIISSQKIFLLMWFAEIEKHKNMYKMEKVAEVARWIRECV